MLLGRFGEEKLLKVIGGILRLDIGCDSNKEYEDIRGLMKKKFPVENIGFAVLILKM